MFDSVSEPEISVVVPTFGAELCLAPLYERLKRTLDALAVSYELVFVEDESPDSSWAILSRLARQDKSVRALKLSRNFGQQIAIAAGLSRARGRWTVVMDCDLQDPPEYIPELYAEARRGYDIVLARRTERQLSPFRRLCNWLYFSIVNLAAGTSISGAHGCFGIFSAEVRQAYLRFSERRRHHLMILHWLGFRVSEIEYPHAGRYAGESSYTWSSLINLALDGLLFQTRSLLKGVIALGLLVSLSGVLTAAWAAASFALHGAQPGWIYLMAAVLIIGGAILFCQGIVCFYVSEIFDQAKGRPLFVFNDSVLLEESSQDDGVLAGSRYNSAEDPADCALSCH